MPPTLFVADGTEGAGHEDVRRSISGWGAIQAQEGGPEIVIYRPTEALPLPKRAAE